MEIHCKEIYRPCERPKEADSDALSIDIRYVEALFVMFYVPEANKQLLYF